MSTGCHHICLNRATRLGCVSRIVEEETIMRKLMSALIALSVLAGVATSVNAQTKEDDDAYNYWKQQERNLP